MSFLSRATRNLFFTGKGGVGKTSWPALRRWHWQTRASGAAGEHGSGVESG